MEHVDAINLDAKAIEIVSDYIDRSHRRWEPLKLPECMHITGDAWVHERYFNKDDPYNFNVEIIWKCIIGYDAKYVLVCHSSLDRRLFILDYRDRSDDWVLNIYGAIDGEIIKNTGEEN